MRSVCLKFLILCFLPSASLLAGDWERLLFLDGLHKIPEEIEATERANLRSKIARLTKRCDDNPDHYCVEWQLSLSSALQETEAREIVEDALQVWIEGAGLPIQFTYVGLTESNDLPYARNAEGEMEIDDFGNPILEGPFIFSFQPPEEINFKSDEVSLNRKYILYEEDAGFVSLEWGAIFINPSFNPLVTCTSDCLRLNGYLSYSLRSVLVYEIGRLLGLGPSGLPQSVMYPLQVPQTQKRYDFLREDDTAWIRSLYELSVQNSGRLSGKIINGRNGREWAGAHVVALPLDSVQAFTETVDLNLFVQSAITKSGGKFVFPAMKAGSYILLAEAMDGTRLLPSLFDDWIKVFGTNESFEPDFYDGKGRESNRELLRYSPRGAWFAAVVHVKEGEETKDVEIVTNIFGEELELIEAKGASNETLSPFQPENLDDLISQQRDEENIPSSGGGGCSLKASDSKASTPALIWLWANIIAMLFLRYRFRKLPV